MKKGIGIAGLIIIGLLIPGVTRGVKPLLAAPEEEAAKEPSLYELLHTKIPITQFEEIVLPIFPEIPEEVTNGS